jgi:hypothetical protein
MRRRPERTELIVISVVMVAAEDTNARVGTVVSMKIDKETERSLNDVFDEHASKDGALHFRRYSRTRRIGCSRGPESDLPFAGAAYRCPVALNEQPCQEPSQQTVP